ncbi:thiamine-phosphate pyrophosphorylase [Brevundimonas alba]|uniref:Thiamine-phosphate pyrophosphorylase n=1 Tax=Brevundimonas alba TaxID=74314 RepID=A0A7X5YIT8_9CAUL|nr:thiamine phosphate synthase [Brevundimonas alba]NJC40743.1 thiamine-phosphate pyrophosphorylase [Brevundimonas alba]
MNRSDAEILWEVASVLARDAANVSRAAGRPRPNLPPLLFFTDPERTPRPWETAARLPAGSGVVFRAFGASDARETGLRLREATRRRDGLLLVGLDAELAEAVEADGVHLPERALTQAPALAAARPDWRITGAVHSAEALANAEGLDATVLSPVFAAGGASASRPPLGMEAFSALVGKARTPVYALGGIDAGNARGLIGSGACGLAGVSAIRAAFGPD